MAGQWLPTLDTTKIHELLGCGPFQHVKSNFLFIYFYLSKQIHNYICIARWVSRFLLTGGKSKLPLWSVFSLGSAWVSSEFVDEMVWKRSRLLNCTLSQHKQRAFPPGPRLPKWPSADGLCSGCTLRACVAGACTAKTNCRRLGLRMGWDVWTSNDAISCINTKSMIWVWVCLGARLCGGPIDKRTAMWSTDGTAYGWVKA